MAKKIAIYGGSFNPPGKHHWLVVKMLTRYFDQVIVVPCGQRPDKLTVNDIESIHRATMADMAFSNLKRVWVELSDLEKEIFTRAWELDERFKDQFPKSEIWHAVGSDLIQGGRNGKSVIQKEWEKGPEVWQNLNFAIITRDGFDFGVGDLPPRSFILEHTSSGSSSEIKAGVFNHQSIDGLVLPQVQKYIERYGLYRGGTPSKMTSLSLDEPRILIIADKQNRKALELASRFNHLAASRNPNAIFVIGGDGHMLHTIRKHWCKRLPFIGINAGYKGFLLNESSKIEAWLPFPKDWSIVYSPLLYIETINQQGRKKHSLAFNDCWLRNARGQSAWLEVKINHQIRLEKLIGDGILLTTAAGSTAYARSMGATPLPIGTQVLTLVGSHVSSPSAWKQAHLPLDSLIEIRNLEPNKRPTEGYVDGVFQGRVREMRVRISRIAAAELAFLPEHDMSAKLLEEQFPQAK